MSEPENKTAKEEVQAEAKAVQGTDGKSGGNHFEESKSVEELEGFTTVMQRLLRHALARYVLMVVLMVGVVWGSMLFFKLLGTDGEAGHSGLEVVAGIDRVSQGWSSTDRSNVTNTFAVAGRVLDDGIPADRTLVWCIVRDEAGNRFSPTNVYTDAQGQFRAEGIPAILGQASSNIRVYARQATTNTGWFKTPPKKGECVIAIDGVSRPSSIMDSRLWPCTLGFFCISILVGLSIHVMGAEWRPQLYFCSVCTALLLTMSMLWAIAEAYMKVKTSVTPGQTWSIGFISIFEGAYIKDVPKQWLISLTGPPEAPKAPERDPAKLDSGQTNNVAIPSATGQPAIGPAVAPALIQGLGAPMWVVFLAVIGAALSTVALIVNEIKTPPNFAMQDPEVLRERLLGLVQNQFFMLFAPLGGIFIYQALVLAGAASQQFVVAVAALGAGATLNILLSLALTKASAALMPESQKKAAAAAAADETARGGGGKGAAAKGEEVRKETGTAAPTIDLATAAPISGATVHTTTVTKSGEKISESPRLANEQVQATAQGTEEIKP
jgi:hypothetical protein